MDFVEHDEISANGFSGFVPFRDLRSRRAEIPEGQGVYLVVSPPSFVSAFMTVGTGGFFKGIDPNVSTAELAEKWVEGTAVVYIGKAGGAGVNSTLRKRLLQYLSFGEGKPVGHKGGRYIWQLKDSQRLVVCWKVTPEEPLEVERDLIADFKAQFGRRPFANLKD